mgnify:CR=1 FL=1
MIRLETMQAARSGSLRAGGFSLVEVLIAAAVLALVGVFIQGTMVQTLRGVQIDRLTEAKRQLTLDLLERFCHPYSSIGSLYPPGNEPVKTRTLTVEQAMDAVAMPDEHRVLMKSILETGYVTGFNLVWERAKAKGIGDPNRALALNILWVFPVVSKAHPGPRVDSFRAFYIRGVS